MLQEIQSRIQLQKSFRRPFSSNLNLAVTLRHLASGETFLSLQYNLQLVSSTIVKIIPKVCQVTSDKYPDDANTPQRGLDIGSIFIDRTLHMPCKHTAIRCLASIQLLFILLVFGCNLH